MYFIYATVCAILCIVTGSAYDLGPLNSTVMIGEIENPSSVHEIASNNLIGLLEYLRRLMSVGVADIAPPMDPYVRETLPSLEFNTPGSLLRGDVELSNLVVSGGKKYTIEDIRVQIESKIVEFNVTVPQVVADFDYLTTNFVFNETFVFNISGHVQVTLENFKVVGALCTSAIFQDDDNGFLYYKIVGLQVTNTVDNLKIDEDLSLLPTVIIDEIKDMLFLSVAKAAKIEMDYILYHFSQEQVLAFLVNDASPYSRID